MEPFLDITSINDHLQQKQPARKKSKNIKSLATICKEVLGIIISKVWFFEKLCHVHLSRKSSSYIYLRCEIGPLTAWWSEEMGILSSYNKIFNATYLFSRNFNVSLL